MCAGDNEFACCHCKSCRGSVKTVVCFGMAPHSLAAQATWAELQSRGRVRDKYESRNTEEGKGRRQYDVRDVRE